MFSRLQASFPILTDEIHVDRWIKKIFPWKPSPKNAARPILDNRECYRLDMKNLPSLDATLVTGNGAIIDIDVLNLSASGLSCRVSNSEALFKGQVLTLIFVLPLEEPVIVKTEPNLISVNPNEIPDSQVLRIEFSENLDTGKKDLIHRYIVHQQFNKIQQLNQWRFS